MTRSGPSAPAVSVQAATGDGTATAGSDYASTSVTLSFGSGDLTKTVSVPVNGDVLFEPYETFNVVLSSPTNAVIDDGTGVGTIANDDPDPGSDPPAASIADASISEGDSGQTDATFTVTLSAPTSEEVTIPVATTPGTATAPSDFTSTNDIVVFEPGVVAVPFPVPVNGDTAVEPDETFTATLGPPTNADDRR